MQPKERFVLMAILATIALMVALDLITDAGEGVVLWHIFIEVVVGVAALFGIFYLSRGSADLRRRLENEMNAFREYKKEAEAWRADSRKYIEGLAQAIDQQLNKWNLTVAEREVAFLLLKGLSLKEIAHIRQTSEKTARAQAIAIYAKSGLAGRSELSAFFLEDLLSPSVESSQTPQ